MNNNDFFSNTNPDLVNVTCITELDNAIIISETTKRIGTLGESSKNFYKKYIQPNLIPIIILILFIGFMIYRYMSKSPSPSKEDFDPSKPIDSPKQTVLELSETAQHHKLDNVINNIIQKNEIDEILNDEDMYKDLYNPNKDDEFNRDLYYGTNNDHLKDKVIQMDEHPYGYQGDFINMENDMLRFSTEQNKTKLDEAASMLWS